LLRYSGEIFFLRHEVLFGEAWKVVHHNVRHIAYPTTTVEPGSFGEMAHTGISVFSIAGRAVDELIEN
jgi:hypothetical protein